MVKILWKVASVIFWISFLFLGALLLGSLLPIENGYQIRIVESGSMAPTIPLGSALIVRSAESYAIGDVVTFQRVGESEATTHRVMSEIEEEGSLAFITQGDANNTPDQRPVAEREIVGKVVWSIPVLGFVLDFIRKPIGFMILIGIPAGWIIYEQWRKIVAEVRRQKNGDADESKT